MKFSMLLERLSNAEWLQGDQAMEDDGGNKLFNNLTIVTLVATVCLVGFYGLIAFNIFNPFPPPTSIPVAQLPTETPTPTGPARFPTWTPTHTPTMTPPLSPTRTSRPTLTPSVSPTFPPTAAPTATETPTPRATRSPWPFTCEVELRRPQYDRWSGVAGHTQDLDGNALPGYHVQVQCPGLETFTPRTGADERFNIMYGSEAAWEQACNPSRYQELEVRVQLFNNVPGADGTYRAVSDVMIAKLGGYASASLGYVTCTLNWEEWQ
jgi:hypothetical protein